MISLEAILERPPLNLLCEGYMGCGPILLAVAGSVRYDCDSFEGLIGAPSFQSAV
jgi:hypothetical protein